METSTCSLRSVVSSAIGLEPFLPPRMPENQPPPAAGAACGDDAEAGLIQAKPIAGTSTTAQTLSPRCWAASTDPPISGRLAVDGYSTQALRAKLKGLQTN